MGGFDLKSLLSNTSLNVVKDEKRTMKIVQLNVYDLIPSTDNFYSVEDITTLKVSIEMFGIQQNLTVKPLDNGKYRVIAGHRRRLASLSLVKEGKQEFKMIPCVIETDLDDIKEQLLLIITNATTRKLTDWEKMQQAQRMRELLEAYRKQENISGRTREIIAQVLETSPSQVARMDSIARNLSDDFQDEFKKNEINISTAYELSTLGDDVQQEVYGDYQETGSLSIQDVKNKKAEIKEQAKDCHIDKQEKQEPKRVEVKKQPHREIEHIQTTSIPTQMYPTIHEIIEDMNKQELAGFICSRCDGSGFCDYITECCSSSIANRPKICEKWLNMQAQKNK